jgi:hypothetical protein
LGGGNEIHAPCACDKNGAYKNKSTTKINKI